MASMRPQGECRAKGAIYGGDNERPATPEHHGKKMVHGVGAGAVSDTPYATFAAGGDGERYPSDFHMLDPKGKAFAGKVGTQEIGAAVYAEQIAFKQSVTEQSRMRNSGGPAPYAASTEGVTAYPTDFALLPRERSRELTGKVGAPGAAWDAGVYAGQRTANALLAEERRAKNAGVGSPFATSAEFDELRRRDYYHAKAKKDDTSDAAKPYSQQGFDASVYSEQLRVNAAQQHESMQRSFVGSGSILAPGGRSDLM